MYGFIRNLLVVLVVCAAAVPLAARPAAAIAHGEDAPHRAYRFSALLTMTGLPADGGGTRDSWCSGALIAPRWVITAGHCFRDAGGQRVDRTVADRTVAVVGRSEPDGIGGQEAEVVAVHQAEYADVALAELGTAITDVTPIPITGEAPRAGEVLRLTGFGLTTGDGTRPPARLQTGTFTVAAVGDTLVETAGLTPRADTSPCPHDSGGPYFREGPGGAVSLVAVVSSGPSCPHTGADLSARVDTLAGWAADTMAQAPDGPVRPSTKGVSVVLVLLTAAVLTPVLLLRARWRRGATAVRQGV
ncbi:trypsin-like serine protease [Actinoplanes sp. DH11]|uniref:S1 family peptidase n=1 Tax=Actinoplanes sp. DH11 TaxID=2857011 RepID=UPI001E404D03|nr:trypsin-like serine protease [Actinoplanes sp. DH11]